MNNPKLIVGLGNPGRRYANSRHNVGFHCIDFLSRKYAISVDRRRFRSKIGSGHIHGTEVLLAKPRTFMNLSGEAVVRLARYFRVPPADLVVIYDDVDLPFGKLRIRERGSAGGHNGMKSIIGHLGTQEFPRIRIGIAPLDEHQQSDLRTPQFVLSDLSNEERNTLTRVMQDVAGAIESLLTEGIAVAMNRYN